MDSGVALAPIEGLVAVQASLDVSKLRTTIVIVIVSLLVVVLVLGFGAFRWAPLALGEMALVGLAAPAAVHQAPAEPAAEPAHHVHRPVALDQLLDLVEGVLVQGDAAAQQAAQPPHEAVARLAQPGPESLEEAHYSCASRLSRAAASLPVSAAAAGEGSLTCRASSATSRSAARSRARAKRPRRRQAPQPLRPANLGVFCNRATRGHDLALHRRSQLLAWDTPAI